MSETRSVCEPEVLGRKTCIEGTRIRVEDVLVLLHCA